MTCYIFTISSVRITPMSSHLLSKLNNGQLITTVEINPPASHDPQEAINEAKSLPEGIDAIDITNCAFSRVRISPVALGKILADETGKDIIINYTCRDRNMIGAKSDLLGALSLGIGNVLCMTGDDPKMGDHPDATAVYDLDTCSLISLCKELKAGENTFAVGAAAAVETDDVSMSKLQAKLDSGADFFMTQPVYTVEDVETAVQLQQKVDRPFIIGVLPFKSAKMAESLAAVPGINVPQSLVDELKDAAGDDVPEICVERLIPVVQKIKEIGRGLHIMHLGDVWKVERFMEI